eukprot:364531-Chlamydomonas_euryale.AAC.9
MHQLSTVPQLMCHEGMQLERRVSSMATGIDSLKKSLQHNRHVKEPYTQKQKKQNKRRTRKRGNSQQKRQLSNRSDCVALRRRRETKTNMHWHPCTH